MTTLEALAKEIKETNCSKKITPRMLVANVGYEKRSPWARYLIDKFLEENELEVEPHYMEVWIDNEIELRQKPKAKKRRREDPIKRIGLLKAANIKPTTVNNNDTLDKAITLMMMNGYSQLPVMGNSRKIIGYISWETIGEARSKGVDTNEVKNYKREDVSVLRRDMPLMLAIREIYKKDFIVVVENDGTPCGIVTTADVSSQFLTWTEPFVMLEQIENQVRHLLNEKILLEDLKNICQEEEREVNAIDDLTFGEYQRLFENPKHWDRIGLKSFDRSLFVQMFEDVRKIRNDVMHFDPEGIDEISREKLKSMANFLNKLIVYK